tara:strand:+ start:1845 stop:2027 length:183 start_codon:yes stop_codon:yes gene_type:complete
MGYYKDRKLDGDVSLIFEDPEDAVDPYYHVCKFPETGMKKSWCSCGQEGHYDFSRGKYVI